jgi:proteic killer suppression protein
LRFGQGPGSEDSGLATIAAVEICTIEWYIGNKWGRRLIVSFRDDWLRDFFVADAGSKKIPADLEARLFRKIQMIDDATSDQDLRVPPSNHFERLKGNLAGLHSIRVNKQWRLIFAWDAGRGAATGIYLDNHSYS